MFRLGQLARHISRPLSSTHALKQSITSSIMAQQKSLIHTAACLIIGDEVLGGKVSCAAQASTSLANNGMADGGHKLGTLHRAWRMAHGALGHCIPTWRRPG
jgi:hypothetical protein